MTAKKVKSAPGAHLEEAKDLGKWLGDSGEVIQLQAPDSVPEAMDMAVEHLNQSRVHYAKTGFYLMWVKEKSAHGEFLETVDSYGVSRRVAQESMKVAAVVSQLPAVSAQKLLAMPKKKALALANLDADQLDLLLEEQADELDAMPREQLKALVQKLEQNNANLNSKVSILGAEKKVAEDVAAGRATKSPFPAHVSTVRQEANVFGQQMLLAADGIEELVATTLLPHADGSDNHELAERTVYVQVRAVQARIQALAESLAQSFGEAAKAGYAPDMALTDDELIQAAHDHELLMAEHKQQKVVREHQRQIEEAAGKPRGRGRPMGSKAKAK